MYVYAKLQDLQAAIGRLDVDINFVEDTESPPGSLPHFAVVVTHPEVGQAFGDLVLGPKNMVCFNSEYTESIMRICTLSKVPFSFF